MKYVSFIGQTGWVVIDDNKLVDWDAADLSGTVRNLIEASGGHGKRACHGDVSISSSNDDATFYFVQYSSDATACRFRGAADFQNQVNEFSRIDVAAVGPNGSYILSGVRKESPHINGSWLIWNLPDGAGKSIEDVGSTSTLETAALGADGNYYIQYDSGASAWGGSICDDLTPLVKDLSGKSVKYVALCAYDSTSYFVRYSDGSSAFRRSQALINALTDDIIFVDPLDILYLNDSISNQFCDGKSINETRDDLSSGTTRPEDIPAMEIFRYKQQYYTLSHRRLWCFRESFMCSVPATVVQSTAAQRSRIQNGAGSDSIRIRNHSNDHYMWDSHSDSW